MTDNELINDLFAWERSIKPIDNNVACILNQNQYEYLTNEFNKMKPQKKYNSLADLKNELPVNKFIPNRVTWSVPIKEELPANVPQGAGLVQQIKENEEYFKEAIKKPLTIEDVNEYWDATGNVIYTNPLKNELPVDAKEIPEMQNMYLLTNDIAKMLIAEYKIEAITSRRGKAGVERKVYYEKK